MRFWLCYNSNVRLKKPKNGRKHEGRIQPDEVNKLCCN